MHLLKRYHELLSKHQRLHLIDGADRVAQILAELVVRECVFQVSLGLGCSLLLLALESLIIYVIDFA